jgi:hypothetical protein
MTGEGWAEQNDAGRLIRHAAPASIPALAQNVDTWLVEKGFQTEHSSEISGVGVIRAREPRSWKTTIGASPILEVRLAAEPQGTRVSIRLGKAGGAVWVARYFTYSWVALGISFLSIKGELEQHLERLLQHHGAPPSPELTVLEVQETSRSERRFGTDERTVDNSGSSSPVTRTLTVRKRWLQTCRIDVENATTGGLSVEAGLFNSLTLSSNVERTIRRQYAISTDVEQEFEEQIELEVPAMKTLILSLDWKRIIQHGQVRLRRAADGQLLTVPYEVDAGITFDQRQLER